MNRNLRKAHDYSIGLDLGTGSVGWAVVGSDGKPYSFGRGRTLGSRVFPSAEPASTARAPRGRRRRYVRRRWRIDLLQRFFAPAMEQVDKDFFLRLNQSRLVKADKDPSLSSYAWPLFNDPGFTEKDYYKRFPTIYHLRAYLCESDEQADLRLVYLALHNIVKCRGNFLYQDNPSLSAADASVDDAVERLAASLADWCEERDVQIDCDVAGLLAAFSDPALRRGEKRDLIKAMFGFDSGYQKALGKEVASAMLGYKANFSKKFSIEDGTYSFSLGNDEKVEEFLAVCPDEDLTLFEALRTAYSAYLLSGILRDADGKTISFCKVREYEQYANLPGSAKVAFWSSGILAGNQTYEPKEVSHGQFWSSGILAGNQATTSSSAPTTTPSSSRASRCGTRPRATSAECRSSRNGRNTIGGRFAMFCPKCGKEIDEGAEKCPECGEEVAKRVAEGDTGTAASAPKLPKKAVAAGLAVAVVAVAAIAFFIASRPHAAKLDREVDVYGLTAMVPSDWSESRYDSDYDESMDAGNFGYASFTRAGEDDYADITIHYNEDDEFYFADNERESHEEALLGAYDDEYKEMVAVESVSTYKDGTSVIDGADVTMYTVVEHRVGGHDFERDVAIIDAPSIRYEVEVSGDATTLEDVLETVELN